MRVRKTAFLAAFGCLLALAGQVIIAHGEQVAHFLYAHAGTRPVALWLFSPNLFPAGVGLGLSLVGMGGLLAALGLPAVRGAESVDRRAHGERDSRPSTGPRSAAAATLVSAAAAVVAAFLMAQSEPGSAALLAWTVSLTVGFTACATVDRERGARIGNPFTLPEAAGVALLSLLCLALVAHDLDDWHWSGTPDESSFFIVARLIAEGTVAPFPLSTRGVFGFQPVASSYYQALFLKIFGTNLVAWRLSSAVALALALPPLYLAVREVWNRRAAVVASVFLGSAQLTVGFAHFGYNNAQVFPVITGALAAMVWATRRGSLRGYFCTGLIAGLGFLTYYAALAVIPLIFLAGASLRRLSLRPGRRLEILALLAPIVLCALPLLASPTVAWSMAGRLTLPTDGPEGTAAFAWTSLMTRDGPLFRTLYHWLQSAVYGLWFSGPHHFQTNPVVDPIGGVLAAIGFWLAVRGALHRSADAFLAPGYLVAAFVAGAVTPHPRPPLTRLLVLAPFAAIFAATALDRLLALLRRGHLAFLVAIPVVATTVVWNVGTLHRTVYHVRHGYGDGTTSELIRLALDLPETHRIFYVQRQDTFMHNVPDVLETYGLRERLRHLSPFDPSVLRVLSEAEPPFVVAYDLTEERHREAVETLLRERYPGMEWRASAPGKPWNLPFFRVDEGH